ncbi:unnamed protein product [Amoebophrya sp. A25]|nr:unnamed protein product [Amoebophrya sp. A25]|eukprot:GSA25T00019774001.1
MKGLLLLLPGVSAVVPTHPLQQAALKISQRAKTNQKGKQDGKVQKTTEQASNQKVDVDSTAVTMAAARKMQKPLQQHVAAPVVDKEVKKLLPVLEKTTAASEKGVTTRTEAVTTTLQDQQSPSSGSSTPTSSTGYVASRTTDFLRVFSSKKRSKKEAPGTTDCAEFTYHNVATDAGCLALCETISNIDVRRNCKWYSTEVDLCSTSEYEYATLSYKGVGVPLNLKSQCDKGNAVPRCKICDRAINFDEQDFVHDGAGDFPWTVLQSDTMRYAVGWFSYLLWWAVFFSIFGALIFYVRK